MTAPVGRRSRAGHPEALASPVDRGPGWMMKSLSPPVALQFLLVMFAGWVNRRQQDVIAYFQAENSVLREQLGGRRLRYTDDQRRRLAAKGKALGRKVLSEFAGVVTPDTILRWYRRLVAMKYDGSNSRGPGRPRTKESLSSSRSLPRTRGTATQRSATPCAISGSTSDATRSRGSSRLTASSRPLSGTGRERGRLSLGPTSKRSLRPTSLRLRH